VYYYIVVVVFLAMFLLIRRLIASPTGAVLLGIRENENRARAIGYNTLRFKVLAITLAGVLAGLAGILYAFLNKKAGPELLAVSFTVNPLLETIVGGVGTFTGPVIGAIALGWMNRQLRNATLTIGTLSIDIGGSWAIILGVIFIGAVILFPYGIVGTFHRWRARWRARREEAQAAGQ
jgi:branched-chain amino acid transport system permease protein